MFEFPIFDFDTTWKAETRPPAVCYYPVTGLSSVVRCIFGFPDPIFEFPVSNFELRFSSFYVIFAKSKGIVLIY
jgi:hypothetical protein